MKIRHITIRTAAFEEEIEFYQTYGAMSIQRDGFMWERIWQELL